MPLQEDHDFFDGFLRGPGFFDHRDTLLGDAGNLDQAGAVPLDDVEGFQAEVRHDASGRHRANAFDEAAAQVLLQPCERGRLCFLCGHNLELPPVLWVLTPVACQP